MISLSAVVTLFVYLIVAGLIFWLLWWVLGVINPPEPFRKVATVVLAVGDVLVVIYALLSFTGGGPGPGLVRP